MAHVAVIALAPGQVGFFDNISGIHLSMAKKEAKVFPGMNTTGLIKAVKDGKITVVSGSLGSGTFVYEAESCMPTYYRLLNDRDKKAIKNRKPTKISETIEKKPEEVKPKKKTTKKKKQVKIEEEVKVEVAPVQLEIKEEVKEETVIVEVKEEVKEEVIAEVPAVEVEPVAVEEVENKEE